MELTEEILEEIAYVMVSKHRQNVMKSLNEKMKLPSQICNDVDIAPNHLSNVLKELSEHDLVQCVNPNAVKGRLYRITDKGKAVVENL